MKMKNLYEYIKIKFKNKNCYEIDKMNIKLSLFRKSIKKVIEIELRKISEHGINNLCSTDYIYDSHMIAKDNKLYLLGGNNNKFEKISDFISIELSENGLLSGSKVKDFIPVPISSTQVKTYKNKVYTLGGLTNCGTPISDVYIFNINSDNRIENIIEGPSLPIPIGMSKCLIHKDKIYLLGGNSNNGPISKVFISNLDKDGSLGPWKEGPELPYEMRNIEALIYNNKLYIIKADTIEQSIRNIYISSINKNGELGPWIEGPKFPSSYSYYFLQSEIINDKIYTLREIYTYDYLKKHYTFVINNNKIELCALGPESLELSYILTKLGIKHFNIYKNN